MSKCIFLDCNIEAPQGKQYCSKHEIKQIREIDLFCKNRNKIMNIAKEILFEFGDKGLFRDTQAIDESRDIILMILLKHLEVKK